MIPELGSWGIRLNVSKVQVESHKHARFGAATVQERGIRRAAEALLGDRSRLKTCFSQCRGKFGGQVLVDLEFQALISSGRSTVPSRANSAAYARAASMSPSWSVG